MLFFPLLNDEFKKQNVLGKNRFKKSNHIIKYKKRRDIHSSRTHFSQLHK